MHQTQPVCTACGYDYSSVEPSQSVPAWQTSINEWFRLLTVLCVALALIGWILRSAPHLDDAMIPLGLFFASAIFGHLLRKSSLVWSTCFDGFALACAVWTICC